MTTKPRVAFAGLGAMGGGMAKNLVKEGFQVAGFDVYQPLVESLVEAGGKAAKTPKEAASDADFFVSMVANAAQNASLLFDGEDAAIKGLANGKTFILCSTTPPSFVLELRKRLDEEGRSDIKLLDCPVSGGTIRAANGTLSIFESGPEAHLDEAKEVLQCMSGLLYVKPKYGRSRACLKASIFFPSVREDLTFYISLSDTGWVTLVEGPRPRPYISCSLQRTSSLLQKPWDWQPPSGSTHKLWQTQ